jgi:hypothetical protein
MAHGPRGNKNTGRYGDPTTQAALETMALVEENNKMLKKLLRMMSVVKDTRS